MKYKHITRTIPIGKQVVDTMYFHSSYINNWGERYCPDLRLYNQAVTILENNFPIDYPWDWDYDIIKINKIANTVSFICSPNFDTADEPSISLVYTVNINKASLSKRTYKPDNCPIYHHKWLMVGDDYLGFNVEDSKYRSTNIINYLNAHPKIDRCKIGFKKYWRQSIGATMEAV